MEGFTGNKDVKPYDRLAQYYDWLLMDEESFSYWLKFIESEPFSTVLELASGSGVMARILKEKGYKVTASDISSKMKETSSKNFDGEYLLLDMTDYHLDKKYDLILCLVDSINYLDEKQLDSFFRCAYEHLNTGGRIIFDTHNPVRLLEFSEEYIEEGELYDGVPYQWTIISDRIENTINEHFTFYDNGVMIQEHHLQHVFDSLMLKEKMNKAGFVGEVITDFIPDEKMLFTGKKQ